MAIVLKRKEVSPPPPPQVIQPTMDMLGLGEVKAPPSLTKKEQEEKDKYRILFHIGDRVEVTNSLYYWVKTYGQGDIGTVVKVSGIPNATTATARDCSYRVLMDNPRVPASPEVVIAQWELRKVR